MIKVQLEYDLDEKVDIDAEGLKTICQNIFHKKTHTQGNITVILTNDEQLLKLKKEYFQQDLLTDVIAFNLEEDGDPVEGEIYISLERVKENTRKFKQNVARELRRVIIHGCLHIMGYDDQTPEGKKEMTQLEDHYLNQSLLPG